MNTVFEDLLEPVQGLIVEGLTLLCSKPKEGKSWLALQMCCAVANGRQFLGLPTDQGDVLYMGYEDTWRRLQDRLKVMHEKSGGCANGELHLTTSGLDSESELLDGLKSWVERMQRPRMIVIDKLQSCLCQMDANYSVLRKFRKFAKDHHIALVLVHDLGKSKASNPFKRIIGSTRLLAYADSAVLLLREWNSRDARLQFAGEDIIAGEIALCWDDRYWKAVQEEED